MLRFVVDTFFKKYAKDLLDREVSLESDAPFDPFEAHLSCSLDSHVLPLNPAKTTIPEGSTFSGSLSSSTPVRIDGHFEGQLVAKEVTIGKTATVKANLDLKKGSISGKVIGNIDVEDHLILSTSAHIHGDLIVGSLSLEEGAIVSGNITIRNSDSQAFCLSS
ncbi:MAG: polymer-forming cytoskeletal protein [Chlamydiia bacterium]|nr:polymer-forming cytoskeletal protein [Chlamydiia bacterium]MCP5510159.1 polymer-forming cytoskeletal protein [Chlamydiales bacterium]